MRVFPESKQPSLYSMSLRSGNQDRLNSVIQPPTLSPRLDPDDIILVDSYGTNLQHSIAAENQYVLLNFVCSCITCGLSTFLIPIYQHCFKGSR